MVVKVAIIGSGLAGLTAAHILATAKRSHDENLDGIAPFEVHLFEAGDQLGMDSKTVSVTLSEQGGQEVKCRIDVPMRSFQGGYYPKLISLYRHIGADFRSTDFSYCFSRIAKSSKHADTPEMRTTFIYNGASGRKGTSPPSNFSSPTLISLFLFLLGLLGVAFNYVRLAILSAPLFRKEAETLSQWRERSTPKGLLARLIGLDALWRDFVDNVVVVLFSAVCTASREDVYDHPSAEILEYVWKTLLTHHYLVTNGVQDVAERLSRPLLPEHIHLSSKITSLRLDPQDHSASTLSVQFTNAESSQTHAIPGFSHVIFATQANQALPILSSFQQSLSSAQPLHRNILDEQIRCLRRFAYRRTVVVNHTDNRLLPADPKDRRDINLVCIDDFGRTDSYSETDTWGFNQKNACITVPSSYAMATLILPKHPQLSFPIYQTTNPTISPRTEKILSVAVLERCILKVDAKKALKELVVEEKDWTRWPWSTRSRLGPLQGKGRWRSSSSLQENQLPGLWFCGAYVHGGIPLLEGCVASARNVVENGICVLEGARGTIDWTK